jgi:hypothetical protein
MCTQARDFVTVVNYRTLQDGTMAVVNRYKVHVCLMCHCVIECAQSTRDQALCTLAVSSSFAYDLLVQCMLSARQQCLF